MPAAQELRVGGERTLPANGRDRQLCAHAGHPDVIARPRLLHDLLAQGFECWTQPLIGQWPSILKPSFVGLVGSICGAPGASPLTTRIVASRKVGRGAPRPSTGRSLFPFRP